MKKIWLIGTLLAVVAAGMFIAAGCTLGVDDIEAEDLPEYNASSVPANGDDALQVIFDAMFGASQNMETGAGEFATEVGNEVDDGVEEVQRSLYEGSAAIGFMQTLLGGRQAESRTITADGESGYSDTAMDGNVSLKIEDEVIEGDAGGKVTVNFDGKTEYTQTYNQDTGTVTFEGSVKVSEAKLDIDEVAAATNDSGVTAVSGQIAMVLDAKADAESAGSVFTFSYDTLLDLKVGLSVSGDKGGKFIFNFYLKEKLDETEIDFEEVMTAEDDASLEEAVPDVELVVELMVYDNAGEELVNESYSEDDFFDVYLEYMSMM